MGKILKIKNWHVHIYIRRKQIINFFFKTWKINKNNTSLILMCNYKNNTCEKNKDQ